MFMGLTKLFAKLDLYECLHDYKRNRHARSFHTRLRFNELVDRKILSFNEAPRNTET